MDTIFTNDPADPHSTDPAGEPIAYAFGTAMVTVYAVAGLVAAITSHVVRRRRTRGSQN